MEQKLINKKINQFYNEQMSKLVFLCEQFGIKGQFENFTTFSSGHINSTFLVEVKNNEKTNKYVLQKMNTYVFKEPEKVMQNIFKTTEHIKKKLKNQNKNFYRQVLDFYKSNNKLFVVDNNNDYWRLYKFVDNSVTYDKTNNLQILEELGNAFGEFQDLLSDYPINDLNIIIPHFHNTASRFKDFKQAIKEDKFNRRENVLKEIEEFLKLEEIATQMYKMQKQELIPLRVTHNDTKCNNVLFDKETNKHLCVIDLDTVMPGLIGFDYGDAIRSCANTANEDEKNISFVSLDMYKFQAFTKGFLNNVASSLTETESRTLALGAITMTIECGIRFLTDYLNGDVYFKTNYDEHNLDRARCQLTLAQDMISKYEIMKSIVNMYYNMYKNKEQIKEKT